MFVFFSVLKCNGKLRLRSGLIQLNANNVWVTTAVYKWCMLSVQFFFLVQNVFNIFCFHDGMFSCIMTACFNNRFHNFWSFDTFSDFNKSHPNQSNTSSIACPSFPNGSSTRRTRSYGSLRGLQVSYISHNFFVN